MSEDQPVKKNGKTTKVQVVEKAKLLQVTGLKVSTLEPIAPCLYLSEKYPEIYNVKSIFTLLS